MHESTDHSRENDCIVCGTCVADILVRPVPLSTPVGGGRLFHVDPIEATTGGIVCNTGVALRRLGMRVAASSLVGGDLWGGLVRSRLDAEGICTQALDVHPTLATSTTAALAVTTTSPSRRRRRCQRPPPRGIRALAATATRTTMAMATSTTAEPRALMASSWLARALPRATGETSPCATVAAASRRPGRVPATMSR